MHRPRFELALLVLVIACTGDDDGGAIEETGTDESSSGTPTSTDPTSSDATTTTAGGDTSSSESSGGLELPPPPTSIDETVAIYGQAWNELDVDRRRALLELAWAEGGIYRDPTVVAEGREALVEAIGAFQQGLPGSTLVPGGEVDSYGTQLRFAWEIEGPTALPGMDVGEVDAELRLVRITGFFGPLPGEGAVPAEVQAYADAWNEPDAAMRTALLADAVTDDVVYRDPTVELVGIDALSEHIGATQEMLGGAPLVLTSAADAYGPVMRYTWAIGELEAPLASGLDMATIADDGRLAEVIGFFDG